MAIKATTENVYHDSWTSFCRKLTNGGNMKCFSILYNLGTITWVPLQLFCEVFLQDIL